MDKNSIEISNEDFQFFSKLDDDEKILCLFDMWILSDNVVETEFNFIKEIIDSSIKNMDIANIVITNDLVIINANAYKSVKHAAQLLFEHGYVLRRQLLTEAGSELFQRQKYCNVYEILGHVEPISLN